MSNYMQRALSLATLGAGFTNPNPLVGAVIVKNGQVIGEGWHQKYGGLHAERNAIADAIAKAGGNESICQGAEIYVTLEPCCHTGRQPPCTDALIHAGIKKVFVGSQDPNKLVAGKGIEILRQAGIEVAENVLRAECDALNAVFFYYITHKMPYLILKYALSANGIGRVPFGFDKAISGKLAHHAVQVTRSQVMAVLTGIETVLADDPRLNCRLAEYEPALKTEPRQPIRIVCDTSLRIPENSRLVKTAQESPVIVACSQKKIAESALLTQKKQLLEKSGVQILAVAESDDGHIDLRELLRALAQKGIDSVLVESSGTLSASLLSENLVQKVQVYVSPKFLSFANSGDFSGIEAASCHNEKKNFSAYFGQPTKVELLGDDVLIEYNLQENAGGTKATLGAT